MGGSFSRDNDPPPPQPRAGMANAGMYLTPDQLNAMVFEGLQPQAPAPMIQSARTLRNDVNVKRESIALAPGVGSGSPPKHFNLTFTMDLAKPCFVTVYYAATETTNQDNITIGIKPKRGASGASMRRYYPKGLNQKFDQAEHKEEGLAVSKYSNGDLQYKPSNADKYPIIIMLQATDACESAASPALTEFPDAAAVQCQLTYCDIVRHADGTLGVKVLKQKIHAQGQAFEMQAIYGIERAGTSDDTCVVCLTNPKDMTVLPCRHMCLCRDCAEQLRTQTNKCPICRAPVETLLKIDLAKARGMREDEAGAGAGAGNDGGAGAGAGVGADGTSRDPTAPAGF